MKEQQPTFIMAGSTYSMEMEKFGWQKGLDVIEKFNTEGEVELHNTFWLVSRDQK